MKDIVDFLAIGGGVVGLSIACRLRSRYPQSSVLLLEKEYECSWHASGRNSGVLHAGFYYSADSLKARFCREGNLEWRRFADAEGVAVRTCGKLVVARRPDEVEVLKTLYARGLANGVPVELITEDEARRIEPRVRTAGTALWSPSTASMDPAEVGRALVRRAERLGVEIRTSTTVIDARHGRVTTERGDISAGFVVNAAGLYAESIARRFGFAETYRILPFKGLYIYQAKNGPPLRTHVYPVPELRNPFLGVHFTLGASGSVKIGPTATPAFWREQYGWFERFRLSEAMEIVRLEASLFLRDSVGFRSLAFREVLKYHRPRLVRMARELLEGVREQDFRRWGRPGIRAQLLNLRTRALVQEFVIEADSRSLHVLNAVSPAWTYAFPFADAVVNQISDALH